MPCKRWTILLCAVLPGLASGQSISTNDQRQVDAVFAAFTSTTPGCALGIYRDGRIALARGYGLANLEHQIPISAQTVFDIGSTSKQFTAASILLLAQEGKLSVDDPIRKWIPELPPYGDAITIRQLLHHTSGIRDYLTLMNMRGISFDGITTDRDALDIIVRQKQTNFAPGSEYLYSNSGYFLLGEIVKRASGKPLPVFAQERIFTPLEMRNTHFHADHTMVVPLRATGYVSSRPGYAIAMSGFEQTGDGAVMTTVEDLIKWDRNFYDPKVGGAALLRDLQTRGVLASGDSLGYARGLTVGRYRGLRSVRHGGSWAGYRAELLRFPDEKTSVAVLCNLGNTNPSRLAEQVADVVLAGRLAPSPPRAETNPASAPTTPPAQSAGNTANRAAAATVTDVQGFAGSYYSEELDIAYMFRVRDGRLIMQVPNRPEVTLEQTGPTTFRGGGLALEFQSDGSRVVSAAGRVRNIVFVRR
jgi:CubicO group peptidase (beta-lactamase class C family)